MHCIWHQGDSEEGEVQRASEGVAQRNSARSVLVSHFAYPPATSSLRKRSTRVTREGMSGDDCREG